MKPIPKLIALLLLCALVTVGLASPPSGDTKTLTVGNSAGVSLPPTPLSFIAVPTSDGPNAVTIDVSGTWTGTGGLSVWTVTSGSTTPRVVASTSLCNTATKDFLGITSGATGQFTTTISGGGTVYVVAPSNLTGSATVTLRVGVGTSGGATAVNGTVSTITAGSFLVAPPSSWATGTDWTTASTPALPGAIKAIWIGITAGTSATLEIDGGGATGIIFQNVQAGWWPVPPGVNITKIYAAANGSTSLANIVVVY